MKGCLFFVLLLLYTNVCISSVTELDDITSAAIMVQKATKQYIIIFNNDMSKHCSNGGTNAAKCKRTSNIMDLKETIDWFNEEAQVHGYSDFEIFVKLPDAAVPFQIEPVTKLVKKERCAVTEVEETHEEYKIKNSFV